MHLGKLQSFMQYCC